MLLTFLFVLFQTTMEGEFEEIHIGGQVWDNVRAAATMKRLWEFKQDGSFTDCTIATGMYI